MIKMLEMYLFDIALACAVPVAVLLLAAVCLYCAAIHGSVHFLLTGLVLAADGYIFLKDPNGKVMFRVKYTSERADKLIR